jgi:hypothetical protein
MEWVPAAALAILVVGLRLMVWEASGRGRDQHLIMAKFVR